MPGPIQIADLNNAKVDVDHIADIANSEELTAVDRLGRTKHTLEGKLTAFDTALAGKVSAWDASLAGREAAWDAALATNEGEFDDLLAASGTAAEDQREDIQTAADIVLAGIGYAPPVAYTAGIDLTTVTQTVSYDGAVYAPTASSLPFTTSGSFESGNFRLIQGVSGADLAASSGAGMVGYTEEGTGAVYLSLLSKIRSSTPVHAKGFNVLTSNPDNIAGFADLVSSGAREVWFDAGTYNALRTSAGSDTNDGTIMVPATSGLRLRGRGKGVTMFGDGQATLTYAGNLFWLADGANVEFHDLTLRGPTNMPTTGSAAPLLRAVGCMDNTISREIRFNNVEVDGWFAIGFQKSQGSGTADLLLEYRNCKIRTYHGAVKIFAADGINAKFHAFDTIFARGGIPFGASGYPYDHALYIHPHVNIHMERCSWPEISGNKFALHHYSGAGKTSPHAKYARFIDCDFRQFPATQTLTVSIASPGVFTQAGHSYTNGTQICLNTTGALPTGLSVGQLYFVVNSDTGAGTFQVALTSGGTAINTSGTQSGTHYIGTPGAVFEQSDQIPLEFLRCKFGQDVHASLVKPVGTTFTDCGNDNAMCELHVNDAVGGGVARWVDGVWKQRTGSLDSNHNYPGQWSVKGTKIVATTNNVVSFITCGGTSDKLHVEDVECVSTLTGTDRATSPFTATAGSAAIEINNSSIRGIYGLSSRGGLFEATGTFTGDVNINNPDASKLDASTSQLISASNTSIPANTIKVKGGKHGGARMHVATGGNRQQVTPTPGVCPTAITAAASISPTFEYDTYVVDGTTAIENINMNGNANSQLAMAGRLHFIVKAAWSTANTGNITPSTTSARTVNEVIPLALNPVDGEWYV